MILRISNKTIPVRNLLFVIGEGCVIYLAVLIAAFLRLGSTQASLLSGEVLGKALLITAVFQLCLYYHDLYSLKATDTYLELGIRLIQAIGVASIALAIIYYCIPSFLLGRGIFFLALVLLVLFVVAWRYAYSWILKRKMFAEKVLILGYGNLSREIIIEITSRPDTPYQIAGVVSRNSNPPVSLSFNVPLFSMNKPLHELARSLRADKIVVAMDEKRGMLPTAELLRCKMNGVNVLQGETLYEQLTGKLFIEKLNPSWLIFSEGFRKSFTTELVNRTVNMVLASVGLLTTLPLVGIIALAIKLNSKGPIFFKQERCGKGGRTFRILKFRSMVDRAETTSGPTWATENDRRVTRVGKALRKYRLDELPQMWNVLKGEMNLVGPRPERPEFVKELTKNIPYYLERYNVKPGITGWAQIWYRYSGSVDETLEKLKYDLFYVKNMSLAMDILVLLQTAKIVLLRRGAR